MSLITKSTYLRGPRGDIGLQGPKGERGLPGAQGSQGVQGPDADPQYVRGQLSASGNVTYNYVTGVIGFADPGYATIEYVNAIVTDLIGNAPAVLDTLKEISDAINNDPDFYNNKLNISGGTMVGALILNDDPTTSLGAATKQYVDNATNSIVSNYNDLIDLPDLGIYQLASAAFNGNYNSLINKPDLGIYQLASAAFNGNYNSLINKPVIPTNTNQLTNGADFITISSLLGYATEEWVNNQGYGNSGFSGNYADLINSPTIPSDINQLADIDGLLNYGGSGASNWSDIKFDGGNDYTEIDAENYSNSEFILAGDNLDSPAVVTAQFSGDYNDLTNKPTLTKGDIGDTGPAGPKGDTGPAGTASITGSWTLAAGANTVSFTVIPGYSYAMWVNGNIPDGIVAWTATVTTSNTNVPAIGVQYGWYYTGGNALVLTSIPNQIVGTAGAISTSSSYNGTTSNVFTFGITNNSGSSKVVSWGYTRI